MWHYKKGNKPLDSLAGRFYAQYFIKPQFEKFGTGDGLLGYGICARCKKQASVVRDAFSEALRAQNRLLWYGRDIRYRKRPPMVRGASSGRITKKGMQKNCTPTINSPDNQTTII